MSIVKTFFRNLVYSLLAVWFLVARIPFANANSWTEGRSAAQANDESSIVLHDPLRMSTLGKPQGGRFIENGGWQVTGAEDMIVFDLGRYIENGSVDLDVRNFRPQEQNTYYRHHFLSMFTNPWGNHHPVEDLESLWDLHAGSNYGEGIKMLSWTQNSHAEKSTVVREAWEKEGSQRLKVVWRGKQLQYFRNGKLYLTHVHAKNFKLRFLFLGRDYTVSADFVTDFKNNQYPALVGPIYSNLVVKEYISADDHVPPQIANAQVAEFYANAAKLAWSTDEPAVCFLEYGLTAQYGNQTPALGLPAQEFMITLDRLQPDQLYHYRLVALDQAGNRTISADQTFTTLHNGRYLFKPSADTYVETAGLYGTTRDRGNFGWMNLLAGKGRESYLRFQVTGFNRAHKNASLRLHARKARGGQISIHALEEDWEEDETTWQTKPRRVSEMVGNLSEVREGEWHDLPLNLAFKENGTYDFVLLSQASELISFDSRESTNFQPEFIFITDGNETPTPTVTDFTDGFSQNVLDANRWEIGRNSGNLSKVVQQALELRSAGAQSGWVITREALKARQKMITVKIVQPSNDGSLGISPTRSLDSPVGIYDEPTWYRFYIYRQGNNGPRRLYVQWKKNNVVDGLDVTGSFNITGEIYLRLRCEENKIYFEVSSNDTNWHTAYAEPFSLTGYTLNEAFHYELASYNTESNGVLVIDDFAIAPAPITPLDSTLPRITEVAAVVLENVTARVTWNTDRPCEAQVEYGPTISYGNKSAATGSGATKHSILLTNLLPNTTYHYRVIAKDAAQNTAISSDFTFTATGTAAPVFADSFTTGTLEAKKWVSNTRMQSPLSLAGNSLKLQSNSALTAWVLTRDNFVARHSAVTARLLPASDGGSLGISPTFSPKAGNGFAEEPNWYRFYVYRQVANGPYRLLVMWRKNGINGEREVASKMASQAGIYLRLRFDDQKIFFETSGDGMNWTTGYSEVFALPGYLLRDAFHYELAGGKTESSATLAVDDFTIWTGNKALVPRSKTAPLSTVAESVTQQPVQFTLKNYPNPFKQSTQLAFELPVTAEFELKVYDALGHVVRNLKLGKLAAGQHEIMWDGKNNAGYDLSSGIYFVHLRYRIEQTNTWSQLIKRATILR